MKLNVTYRVFLAILAANGIIVCCMFLIMQWSMDRGFLKYVNQLEQNRLERLAAKFGQAYSMEGSWESLQQQPDVISRLISETAAEDFPQHPQDPAHWMKRPPLEQPKSPQTKRHHRLERRIVVLDAKRSHIFGSGNRAEIENFTPISVNGAVVGYLGMPPSKLLSDVHQLSFVKEQKHVFALVALLMLVVAAAITLPLARLLVRPLKRLAAATSHLSSGRYDIRIPVDSDDEFGHLSRDFNSLALTLEKNEYARRQFVADISHELRTPLSILKGELEAIQDGIQDLSLESIGSLQAEVSRLNRLVEDLYQLALSDVGALAYRKADLDLGELLGEAVERARPKLIDRSLTVSELLPENAVYVCADADRLAQLFDNILENTRRYTDQGGSLEIALASRKGWATVDFKDSAPGVTEEDREKLFDRLYRVEGSRSRSTGGAGLGLAICRNIVEAHGGTIEALHSPFGGVWIRIALPESEVHR
ncbi:MAG: two-component sensor histidine kinase [Geobacteraceae bacterium GWB2_52_12]|nr:MAG: two-component sensor histidine kinase [Geobacteraceae bacterium GWB2_52_12]